MLAVLNRTPVLFAVLAAGWLALAPAAARQDTGRSAPAVEQTEEPDAKAEQPAPDGATEATPAEERDEERDASVSESVQDATDSRIAEKRQALIAEATSALEETQRAFAALEEGDTEAALEALSVATGKLELVVARDPGLALAPVDVALTRRDLLGDVEAIRAARYRIEDLIDRGEIQKARPLLRDFASEVVIETTNLPLGTYPEAIKQATALIDRGQVDAAKEVLTTALTTLVVTEAVIPLPILRAEALLAEAKAQLGNAEETTAAPLGKVEEATEDATAEASAIADPEARVTAAEYVDAARAEIEIAEALGYGTRRAFTDLRKELRQLERNIDRDEDAGRIFKAITERFDALRDRLL